MSSPRTKAEPKRVLVCAVATMAGARDSGVVFLRKIREAWMALGILMKHKSDQKGSMSIVTKNKIHK